MRAIAPDGIEIAFEVCGAGDPTVLLVHGWSCDRSYWQAQIEPLSRSYRVVAVDLAGHGESGLGRRNWSIAAFGADVAAVVGKAGVGEMVLVGHSMGGEVVLEAARLFPHRVRAIVWVDTYHQLAQFSTPAEVRDRMVPFEQNFVDATRRFVEGMFPANADTLLIQRVVTDMSAAPPAVALPAIKSAWSFGPSVPAILRTLGIPVTAINPEYPPSDLASMGAHGVDVISISNVGHFPMMERPDRFNECLATVIAASVSSTTRPRPDSGRAGST